MMTLELFCLQGMSFKDIKNEAERMLIDLQFEDKRNALSRTLSGGMKRKLRYTFTYTQIHIYMYVLSHAHT